MFYDQTKFRDIDHRSDTHDRTDEGSASNHAVEVINLPPARNWAWAHHGDPYDWMDGHSPFPAKGTSE